MFQTFDTIADPTLAAPRIAQLRAELQSRKLDAYIVPRTDEHQGEYIPCDAERLHWLMGFSGSAGTGIVTTDRAALFVDGRYTVQARNEVDTLIIDVVAMVEQRAEDWLAEFLHEGAAIGFDPKLFTLAQIERLQKRLAKKNIKLKPVAPNLIDKLWGADRPASPGGEIVAHPIEFSGQAAQEKIAQIQDDLKTAGHDATIISSRESIAWLFNLRGSDVAHTPVFSAFAIVNQRAKPELFLQTSKLSPEARNQTKPIAKISAYEKFWDRLKDLKTAGKLARIDPHTASYAIARTLGGAKRIARAPDPCIAMRAIKNETEIAGAREAHKRDGVAVTRFLAWLDRNAGNSELDEITATQKLEAFRAENGQLKEISFDTISGSGPNGAIVHYRVNSATNRKLQQGELYLVDSGAQYIDGTTDITRTVAIGTPTDAMRRHFTLVLKGNIAVDTAHFPLHSRGRDLDPFARRALWQAGLDYDHGTGHGVGSYLAVHEGPVSISKSGDAQLKPGMIVSNEPGYYQENAYGIRIENLVLVREAEIPAGGERKMLSFETLTLAPIDRSLIEVSLLSQTERDWLNAYHARVAKTLGPLLDKPTRGWLKTACAPL